MFRVIAVAIPLTLYVTICNAASVSFVGSTTLTGTSSSPCVVHPDCLTAVTFAQGLDHDNEFEVRYTPTVDFYGVIRVAVTPIIDAPPVLDRPIESDFVTTVSAYNQQGWLLYHASQSFGASWDTPVFELTPGIDASTILSIKVNFTFNPGYVIDDEGSIYLDKANAAIHFNAIPINEPNIVGMAVMGMVALMSQRRRKSGIRQLVSCSQKELL